MIFIATADATISASVPSMVAQGSILANEVMLLAPFAASTSVTCAFILPNGVRSQEQLAEPAQMVGIDGIPPIKDDLGRYYNAWRYTLDGALTEYAGDVTVQFFFRNGSVALASTASTFNVQAGVPVELPDEPSQDIYDQILRALSSLGARLDQTDANVAGLTSFVNNIFSRLESAESQNARQGVQIAELQQYKVNRIFPIDETRVYAADPTGDVSFVLSLVPRSLSVPLYDDGGRLESNDPNAPQKVANKRYVDAQNDLDRAYTDSNAVFRVDVSVNPQTYALTTTARNAFNSVMSQSSVDLPLESMVVGAEVVTVGGVDKLRLTLQNGNTVDIDISAIFDGLATEAMLQDGLALKVNKDVDRAAGQTVVYSQSDSGNSAIRVSLVPVADALPQYNPGGRLKTTAPSAANDAVNLEYYNSRVQPLESDVSTLEGKVSTLEPKVETLEEKADALRDDVTALEEKAETLETVSRENSEKISRNDKRLTNLESGLVPDPFVTDDSTAYAKDVPTGALPYASVNRVGGMTYRDVATSTLRNTPVTEVESVGVNLCPVSSITTNDSASGTIDIYGVNKPGWYTLSADITKYADDTATNTRMSITIIYTDGTRTEASSAFDSSSAESDGVARRKTVTVETDATKTISFIRLTILNYSVQNNRNAKAENIQLEFGDVATEYKPYTKHTLRIPEAVQAIDGYGWGVNEDCYNYIDWDKNQFVKRVGKVDLGTLSWNYNPAYSRFFSNIISDIVKKSHLENYSVCTLEYNNMVYSDTDRTNGYCISNGTVFVRDSAYNDPTAFKAAMSGVMLYYELETPEVTDISNILTADNYIEVQGNGTVTMVNNAQAAVPSSITYQIKEGTA